MQLKKLSAFSLAMLLTGCATTLTDKPLTAENLQHHHWVLEKIDGQPVLAPNGQQADLEIGEQLHASGHGGCNRYTGVLEIRGQQVRIGKMISTRMFCPAPQQEWEQAMNSTLGDWSEARLSPEHLVLKGSEHELVLRLSDWRR